MHNLAWLSDVPDPTGLLFGRHGPCPHPAEKMQTDTCLNFDAEHCRCGQCGGEWPIGENQIREGAA